MELRAGDFGEGLIVRVGVRAGAVYGGIPRDGSVLWTGGRIRRDVGRVRPEAERRQPR